MFKKALICFAMLMTAFGAAAAPQSSIPAKFPITWGASAGAAYIRSIPQTSQIGITNCAASLTDGFPPLTFVPQSAGGCPPFGADFNGILNQASAWARWQAMGAQIPWDSSFSTSIGGYPVGAMVPSASTANLWWQSQVDNNTANPDAGPGANWVGVGYMPTGAIISFGGSAAPPGFLLCFGQQVSRTTFAALFAVVGISYGAGDGTTTFNVPDLRGSTVYGADAMGGTPANRITAAGGGFNAVIGNRGGSQNQTLTQAQLPVVSLGSVTVAGINHVVIPPSGGANYDVLCAIGGSNCGGGPGNYSGATVPIPSFGGAQSHPILSPGQIASYIIKF